MNFSKACVLVRVHQQKQRQSLSKNAEKHASCLCRHTCGHIHCAPAWPPAPRDYRFTTMAGAGHECGTRLAAYWRSPRSGPQPRPRPSLFLVLLYAYRSTTNDSHHAAGTRGAREAREGGRRVADPSDKDREKVCSDAHLRVSCFVLSFFHSGMHVYEVPHVRSCPCGAVPSPRCCGCLNDARQRTGMYYAGARSGVCGN